MSLALAVEDVVKLRLLFMGGAAESLAGLNGSVVDLDNVVAAGDDVVENRSIAFVGITVDKGFYAVDFYLKGR